MAPRRDHFGPDAVSDYDQACAWLFKHTRFEDWMDDDPSDIPLAAKLVCDVFWISPEALLKDMRKIWDGVLVPAPAPRRLSRGLGVF